MGINYSKRILPISISYLFIKYNIYNRIDGIIYGYMTNHDTGDIIVNKISSYLKNSLSGISNYNYDIMVLYDIDLNIIDIYIVLKIYNNSGYTLLPIKIVDGVVEIYHSLCYFDSNHSIFFDYVNTHKDTGFKIVKFSINYYICYAVDENNNIWIYTSENGVPVMNKIIFPYINKVKEIKFRNSMYKTDSAILILENNIVIFEEYCGKIKYGIINEKYRDKKLYKIESTPDIKNNKIIYTFYFYESALIGISNIKIIPFDYFILKSLISILFSGKTTMFLIKYIMVSLFGLSDDFLELIHELINDRIKVL